MSFKAVIRLDANGNTGMGHLVRNIELAKRLSYKNKATFIFLIGGGDKRARTFLAHQGNFRCIEVPSVGEEEFLLQHLPLLSPHLSIVDVLVKDQEAQYMNIFSTYSQKVVAITDDSNPRFIKADAVFNGNPLQKKSYYQHCHGTCYYLGPNYFILNPGFAQANATFKEIKNPVQNILVAFGGADNHNAPLKVAQALETLNLNAVVSFLLSPVYNHFHELNAFLKTSHLNYRIFHQVKSVLPLLKRADLALCSAGNICFEASAAGVPLILINQVKRQDEIATAFARKTFVRNLGMVAQLSSESLKDAISEVIKDKNLRKKMSTHQKKLVDGKGLARVCNIIEKLCGGK